MIKHMLTGIDGETYDPARVMWLAGLVIFLCIAGYTSFMKKDFDMVNFGIAYGTLLAAGAAGVKIKETTEPKEKL